MSFWKKLGEINDTINDAVWNVVTLGAPGDGPSPGATATGRAAAPIGLIWALSKRDESGMGVVDTAKLIAGVGAQASGLDTAGYVAHRPYELITRNALSPQWNIATQTRDRGLGTLVDGEAWKRAWDQRDEVSIGQGMTAFYTGVPSSTFADPKAMQETFDDGLVRKLMSGGIDLAANLFLDPLAIVGKASSAARLASVSVKPNEIAGVVAGSTDTSFLASQTTLRQQARLARKTGTLGNDPVEKARKLNDFYRRTDNLKFSELMVQPEFANTTDAGVLASMFAKANEITDEAARHAAKRDIFGAALGDAASVRSLRATQADLAEQMKRFLTPVEATNGQIAFAWDDYGRMQVTRFNSPDKLKEVLARQTAIKDEFARVGRLLEIAGTTDRIGMTLPERLAAESAMKRVRETVLHDGPGGRPIHVIHGALDARVPGHVDTKNVNVGLDSLGKILGKVRAMPAADREMYLREFGSASDQAARNRVVWRAENAMYTAMAQAEGLTATELRTLQNSTRGVRNAMRESLKSRAYTAAKNDDPVVFIDPDTGAAIAYNGPWLRSQFADTVPIADPDAIDYIIKTHKQTRMLERVAERWNFDVDKATAITNAKNRVADIADDLLTGAMKAWKFAALFRVAYGLRVQVDTQSRLLATLGPTLWALNVKEGAANFLANRAKVANPELLVRHDEILSELRRIDKQIQRESRYRPKKTRKGEAGSLIKGPSPERMDYFERQRARLSRELESIPKEVRRSSTDMKASILRKRQTYRGVDVRPARTGDELAILNSKLSEDGTMSSLMQSQYELELKRLRNSGGWDIVQPSDPNWNTSYLRAVNQQIKNSPVARKILAEPRDSRVALFIKGDAVARAEYRMIEHVFDDPESYVRYARAQIDHLVNDDIREVLLSGRAVTTADVNRAFGNGIPKPAVHGENYSMMRDSPLAKAMSDFAAKWYRLASDLPEQVMGRHPLYNHRFRERMKMLIDRSDSTTFNRAEIDRIRRQADQLARKDVADILFDVTRRSGAADTFKFFSPFFAAWEDTMKKWGKILYDNPEIAVRGAQIWRAPDQFLTVTDSEGNVIKDGKTWDASTGKPITDPAYRGSGSFITLPSWLSPVPGGGNLQIRKDSFNIVFQGEPWWLPGVGPLVQVPTNAIARRVWAEDVDDNPILKFILPYGTTTDPASVQVMPGWAKQVRNAFGDTEQNAQVYAMLAAQEYAKTGKEPSPDKIKSMTRNWFILRAASANVAPVSVTPSPKLQFYIDEAHRMRAAGDIDWQDKFYEQYPEYFEMSLSMSVNNTGIVASERAFDATKRYRKWIAQAPELGYMFVGADNVGAFDPGVYDWQKGTTVSPGSSMTFRGGKDPQKAYEDARTQRGWIEYNKSMMWLDTQVKARGLRSLRQRGAEDLLQTRNDYIEAMRKDNVAWAKDFDQRDSGKVKRGIELAFRAMREEPTLARQGHMQALVRYMQGRDWIRAQLDARDRKSLDDPSNADLAATWEQYTGSLRESNLGFEQLWNRLLESDDLRQEVSP